MKASDFYSQIKNIMGDVTPLSVDCGELCDKSCCKGDGETGMYLFPLEEKCYNQNSALNILDSAFFYLILNKEKKVKIATCDNTCERANRPLSCMLFPLFPYVDIYGELDVRLDVRGRGICPLCMANDINLLSKKFIKQVKYISEILVKNEEIFAYLFETSRLSDEEYRL